MAAVVAYLISYAFIEVDYYSSLLNEFFYFKDLNNNEKEEKNETF
jgi:hypothetical protein